MTTRCTLQAWTSGGVWGGRGHGGPPPTRSRVKGGDRPTGAAGPRLRREGPPLLVCLISSSLTSSLGLTMGQPRFCSHCRAVAPAL